MRTYAMTGGATGIGAEFRRQLQEAGHRVISVDIKEGDILAAWKEVVGEFIAQNSKPTKLKNKILFVRVLQPSVHCVLEQEFKPVILQKLKKRFGAGTVRSIRFSLG